MLQQKHVLCNERNMLSMRLELYKYIEYHCICESDEFSHRFWKPNDKKSCGTLEILTVGILKSLKQDIKSRKYCLFFDLKRDYQIKFHLQKDYAQRNQEVNIKI